MAEHFVTVVLRVPEHVANDLRDYQEAVAAGHTQPVGFVIRPEYIHRIGTLPDPNEAVHERGSDCPCGNGWFWPHSQGEKIVSYPILDDEPPF